ncbi:DUF6440 family protein [Eubacteriaceae bacterium ES3]|nr:DUF6440 family protein [Eubacteriaceae bacterium ES3]
MKTKKMKRNRFRVILDETIGEQSGCRILEDTETGVNYLYHYDQLGSGLTVLVDEEGAPVVGPQR